MWADSHCSHYDPRWPLRSKPKKLSRNRNQCRSFTSFFFFQAEDGIRDLTVTGVQTCALPIFFGAVRAAGADAYVTADLRHHPASEALEAGGPALVDVAHWASEWPWLEHAARRSGERRVGEEGRSRGAPDP